ncbi:TorF family putative porin [Marichromatium gracile]|uniref:TorF family putative porin n=1 Tax=Marichromatium gracile TaxID=1048 RepID=UPI001F20E0A9|nr:TorF family putative porin [Marichromatium gracile]MCF1185032.1 TorF family putative porin [Marichromatium gracile]
MQQARIGAILTATALSAALMPWQGASAEGPHSVSANIGVVSNYIWRGQSQTDDQAAVQGGLDYAHESGFYAGTWASNVDFGDNTSYELDAYLGFAGNITDELGYDLGAVYYAYPDGRDSDFAELAASLSYRWLTAGIAYTVYGQADGAPGVNNDEALYIQGDLYYHASLDFTLPFDLGLSVYGGYTDFEYNDGGNDYGHWGASISREAGDFGTFSLNYDQVGRDTYDDDPKVWVGWNKEF